MDLKPNTTYEFSFDIKGNMPFTQEVRFFVWPKKGEKRTGYNTSLSGPPVISEEKWITCKGEVTTPNEAYKGCLVLFIWGQKTKFPLDTSYLLIDNVVFKEKVFEAKAYEGFKVSKSKISSIPLKLSNSFYFNGYYCPERGFESENYLRLVTNINTNGVRMRINWLYEGVNNTLENWNTREAKPYLYNGIGTITLNGPLIPGLKPIVVSLGKIYIN